MYERLVLSAALLLTTCGAHALREPTPKQKEMQVDANVALEAWNESAECTGLVPPFPLDSIKFIVVDSFPTNPHTGRQTIGEAHVPDTVIVAYAYRDSIRVLAHEIAHLTFVAHFGWYDHPWVPFVIPCRFMSWQRR